MVLAIEESTTMGKAILLTDAPAEHDDAYIEVNRHETKRPQEEQQTPTVHFKETSSTRRYLPDYDESDYPNLFYSQDELDKITNENTKMIRKEHRRLTFDSRRLFRDSDEWSWRGFEYATATRFGKLRIKCDHVKSLVKYQNKHHPSPKQLAKESVVRTAASGSILRARSHAIRDELEAGRIQREKKSNNYRRCKTFS